MPEFIKPKGINFSCYKEITTDELSKNLLLVVNFLQQAHPNTQLNRFYDWWEHDGLHFQGSNIIFDELKKIVLPNGLMQEFKLGDFDVFIGIAPIDNSWYLRFYLDEEENLGRFDITLPFDLAQNFKVEILSQFDKNIKEQNSKEFYRSIICE
jgi:hypothetical protein